MANLLRTVPLIDVDFVRGEGCYLFDSQGRPYLDLESGSWSAILGHGHRAPMAALREQAGRLVHLSPRHSCALAKEAADAFVSLLGWETGSCTFLNSGSEAVEFALQAARRASGRPLLLRLEGSYLAAYGTAGDTADPAWLTLRWRGRGDEELERDIAALPWERIGAFVFEPGGASPSFMRFPPAALVAALAARCREAGVYVVANEITTGMAKTGRWFGHQHYALRPDAVAAGKGLGNGYPISAVALAPALAERYEALGVYYSQSHQNNPLGCAVALAVMGELRSGRWDEKARAVGDASLAALRALKDPFGRVLEARGRGALLGLEFKAGAGLDGAAAYARLWEARIITAAYPPGHPAGTGLRFDLPLCTEPGDFMKATELIQELLLEAPAP